MAYEYNFFSKQLIGNNNIDLSQVFPDLQKEARQSINVSYGLGDIVLYLQDVTQDFKRAERQYVDLDNAIQSIVFKYYDSKNITNPFKANTTETSQLEQGPREAVVIKEGKASGKGKSRTIFRKDEEIKTPDPIVVQAPPVPLEDVFSAEDQMEEEKILKTLITNMEAAGRTDEPEVILDIEQQILRTFGFGREEEAKKWFEENGFDYDKYNQ
jgi:hypothetical protein